MPRDVVCGMLVQEQEATAEGLISSFQGQAYFFCSSECKRRFDQDPARYVSQPAQAPAVPYGQRPPGAENLSPGQPERPNT